MTGVALLQRQARVAAGHALGPRFRERDHAAGVVADLPLEESVRDDVPSEVRSERRFTQHDRHAAELVAVAVHANGLHLDDLLYNGRHLRWHAGSVDTVE